MKEHPIIFSGPMVRAILAGQKTQTRRVIKPQPSQIFYDRLHTRCPVAYKVEGIKGKEWLKHPYQPGDRLWVRETWNQISLGNKKFGYDIQYWYKADDTDENFDNKWRPSIHMPRKACRLILEITAVRVERLQDISEEDARAEGVERWGDNWPKDHWNYEEAIKSKDYNNYLWHGGTNSRLVDLWPYQYSNYHTAKDSFSSLWQLINGKRPGCSWMDNPWVWVIELNRVEGRLS